MLMVIYSVELIYPGGRTVGLGSGETPGWSCPVQVLSGNQISSANGDNKPPILSCLRARDGRARKRERGGGGESTHLTDMMSI